jgi:hypothetical protein
MSETQELTKESEPESSVAGTTISAAWSPTNEKIVVEWCDIAKCYKWLHYRAHQNFSVLHAWFTIPAIILSTISGTASFAQGSLPVSMQLYAPMVIGSVNIFIGILTTIQQYLKISEYNESHRVSAIAWDKFARNIKIELAKHPDDRSEDAGHFLKTNREEFDRLMETSPSIPPGVIGEFIATFSGDETNLWSQCCKKKTDEQRQKKITELKKRTERFEAIKKPDICNIIISADEDKYQWTKTEEEDPTPTNDILYSVVSEKISKIQDEMARKNAEMREEYEQRIKDQENRRIAEEMAKLKEKEAKREAERVRAAEEKVRAAEEVRVNQNKKLILDYISLYQSNAGYKPDGSDLRDSLKDTVEADVLESFILSYGANGV